MSGLVAKNCPSLMKVVPIDCKELESFSDSIAFDPAEFEGLNALRAKAEAKILESLDAYSDFYGENQLSIKVTEDLQTGGDGDEEGGGFWEAEENDSAGENYGGSDLSDFVASDDDADHDGTAHYDESEQKQEQTLSFAEPEPEKKFDEEGYIAIPPCIFGNKEDGLLPPPIVSNKILHAIKYANSTYGHHGEMAWLQMFVSPV